MDMSGVMQVDQLTVPTTLPFAQLNSAAAFASAATVYGVNPPQLTLFDGAISYTAAGVVRIQSHSSSRRSYLTYMDKRSCFLLTTGPR